ncbi:MAG: threonine ammonia-lyase, biosynthetic [Gammaproteobacteria bacterium TMED30]|nr:threonine ammonia-lyase, biosynthetic [Gammaproteobacteria bacterium]OUT99892.1 MAG: threonine ammonia-lyase, biosynthetic [Gammaproteobacteria bacterium TMED30]
MLETYVKKILSSRVYEVADETPLTRAATLSQRLGVDVRLKREDLQSVFSFKLRGAYNKISQLPADELARGVITASAGNHAQGVALAAQRLGIKATIVMGRNTPSIKVNAVRARGAKVILHGDSYDQASAHAAAMAAAERLVYVPPYDDVDVIAGQGTIGMEIVNQYPGDLDSIFVPVGGGGLIAGIAAYVKYLHPKTKVIGVEAEGSACLYAARQAGRRVRLPADTLDLFADGVSVAQVGAAPFKIAKHYVDDVVLVNTDEICAAIKDVFEDARCVAEPAGALAIAGMKRYLARASGIESAVAIVSGANVNFDRLRHISERAELGEEREAILAAKIDEQPGSFLRFCKALGRRAITEFNYRSADADSAHIYVGLGVDSQADREAVVKSLQEKHYGVLDMTDNEAAKLHVRHMVGGRSPEGIDELLYRFEFPERPGALLQFLTGLGQRWNISLFHYRNHGSAWGRVLVGFTASKKDQPALNKYLRQIGYRFWSEQDNPAYKMFLQ